MDIFIGIFCVIISLVGFFLAFLYGRKTKKFRMSEYLAILIGPLLSVCLLVYIYGIKILILFLESSIIGFCFEYLFGFLYHKVLNKRLWNYYRFSLNGYTSFLSMPLWGIAGIIFWSIAKIIGL